MTLLDQPGDPTTTARDRVDERPWKVDSQAQGPYQERKSKRRTQRERRAQLEQARQDRIEKERVVLMAVASGASLREVSRESGISEPTVRRLYHSAMARLETENIVEYRQAAMHSLGLLKQRAFRGAMGSDKEAPAWMREARHIQDQQNRLMAAYPPVGVDVTGTVVHTHVIAGRVVSSLEGLRAQRERQALLALEADAVDAIDVTSTQVPVAAVTTNGHAP